MVHWIYILRCNYEEDEDYYYVGETERLFTRCWEHDNGKGGINTSIYIPQEIVAIYRVDNISNFLIYNEKIVNNPEENESWYRGLNNLAFLYENTINIKNGTGYTQYYDAKKVENNIVECMMLNDWSNNYKIRGGKYVKTCPFIDENMRNDCKNEYIKNIPLCKCRLPCDVDFSSKRGYFYFKCPKKNMQWEEFINNFDEQKPCNFFRVYMDDIELRIKCKNVSKAKSDFYHKKLIGCGKCLIELE